MIIPGKRRILFTVANQAEFPKISRSDGQRDTKSDHTYEIEVPLYDS
ncbi:hypothetical protein CLOSTASPAR_03683 [[Clostridium] asparagiforme DSM 15981]|uniref:Uncharacterized protein n=1 Tax=[Clostridium] asparagiforme DSM 15981 TaxID=518636 RepID=C0D342_9FIRM|nr:hypothetical protein CLOSTASPAR_03683 [[Clostridium] asparagiforme DSM 15981]